MIKVSPELMNATIRPGWLRRIPATALSASVLALVCVLCAAAFSAVAQPSTDPSAPSDPLLRVTPLEQERVAPTNKGNFPEPTVEAGKRRYLIGSYHPGSPEPPTYIYLSIPEEFVGPDRGTVYAWGLNLWVRYPDLVGVHNATANFSAIGPDGLVRSDAILLSISNGIGNLAPAAEAGFNALQEQHIHNPVWNPSFRYTISNFGKLHVVHEIPNDKGKTAKEVFTKDYYTLFDEHQTPIFFVECHPLVSVPSCMAYFSVTKDGGINIKIMFDMTLLPQWIELKTSFTDLVNGFIVRRLP
jgi:hypothetical protein